MFITLCSGLTIAVIIIIDMQITTAVTQIHVTYWFSHAIRSFTKFACINAILTFTLKVNFDNTPGAEINT